MTSILVLGFLALLLTEENVGAPITSSIIIAGVNIPPPPKNKDGEFFFNNSNAVSFSDAYFDYSGFSAMKLKELFDDHGKFGFTSARIQVNAKTALKRWYVDDDDAPQESVLRNTFVDPGALLSAQIQMKPLVEQATGRRYVTPLQTVEYVLSYTNYTSSSAAVDQQRRPRRAIFNFCGTCTGCTDGHIPLPNTDNHGSGTVDDCPTYVGAWRSIAEYFSHPRFAADELHFELFNEPHAGDVRGAKFRDCLLEAAAAINNGSSQRAAEPKPEQTRGFDVGGSASNLGRAPRVIWPATGWEASAVDLFDFANTAAGAALKNFDIGWHSYPFWCRGAHGSACTVQEFEKMILDSLPTRESMPAKTWLTEYGGNLFETDVDYFNPGSASTGGVVSGDADFMRALANVAGEKYAGGCEQIRGFFLWHAGYFFDDSYAINADRSTGGQRDGVAFVRALSADLNTGECAGCTNYFGNICQQERCAKCRLAIAPMVDRQDVDVEREIVV